MLKVLPATLTCKVVSAHIGDTRVAVVDCPGFNDTYRSPTEILQEIARILCTQSVLSKSLRLKGILYLHSLEKTRMEGSDVDALRTFQELVGEAALPHVVLVSTMWGKFRGQKNVAFNREAELRDKFWKTMIGKGSQVDRFDGDTASAQGLVSQLIKKDDVVLALQDELISGEKELNQTSAGASLAPYQERDENEIRRELKELSAQIEAEKNKSLRAAIQYDKAIAEAKNARILSNKTQLQSRVGVDTKKTLANYQRGHNWRGDLQLFCSVLGFGLTTVLPMAGACVVM